MDLRDEHELMEEYGSSSELLNEQHMADGNYGKSLGAPSSHMGHEGRRGGGLHLNNDSQEVVCYISQSSQDGDADYRLEGQREGGHRTGYG